MEFSLSFFLYCGRRVSKILAIDLNNAGYIFMKQFRELYALFVSPVIMGGFK